MDNQNIDLNAMYGIPNCPGGNCGASNSPYAFYSQVPSLEQIAGYNITGVNPTVDGHEALSPLLQRMRQRQELAMQNISNSSGQNQGNAPQSGANVPQSATVEDITQETGEEYNQSSPQGNVSRITPTTEPMPLNVASLQYLNGFMRTQIGRVVKVEFLIGSNSLVDRTGILLAVGANYILMNEIETDDIVACDFYNIKFIKFYY